MIYIVKDLFKFGEKRLYEMNAKMVFGSGGIEGASALVDIDPEEALMMRLCGEEIYTLAELNLSPMDLTPHPIDSWCFANYRKIQEWDYYCYDDDYDYDYYDEWYDAMDVVEEEYYTNRPLRVTKHDQKAKYTKGFTNST